MIKKVIDNKREINWADYNVSAMNVSTYHIEECSEIKEDKCEIYLDSYFANYCCNAIDMQIVIDRMNNVPIKKIIDTYNKPVWKCPFYLLLHNNVCVGIAVIYSENLIDYELRTILNEYTDLDVAKDITIMALQDICSSIIIEHIYNNPNPLNLEKLKALCRVSVQKSVSTYFYMHSKQIWHYLDKEICNSNDLFESLLEDGIVEDLIEKLSKICDIINLK